jgi:endonuclease G
VGYEEARKNPGWVAYRLFKVENPETHPRLTRFTTDERTTAKVKHEDYARSGYDRGHMAPNHAIDICYGREAQLETFLMSNICPQKPKLNRGVWERLEETELTDAGRLEEVWVIDGPIYDDSSATLASGVAVPARFFKILLDEEAGQPRMLAFIMPQEVKGDEQLTVFLVSVDLVEHLTGLDFFSDLEDTLEERLESQAPTEMW